MNPIQKHVLKRNETADMSDRELLMELVEEKRRAETWRYIKLVWYLFILLVIVVLAVKFLPPIISFFRDLYDMIQSVQQTSQEISEGYHEITESINGLNLGGGLSFKDLIEMFGKK